MPNRTAAQEATRALDVIVTAVNQVANKHWSEAQVKYALSDEDPDFVLAVSRSAMDLPDWQIDDIRDAGMELRKIATSYAYYSEDGKRIDPVWEYLHPRTDPPCNHHESLFECKPDWKIKPLKAKKLHDFVSEEKLVVVWCRENLGREIPGNAWKDVGDDRLIWS